jgi:hypothetical protein
MGLETLLRVKNPARGDASKPVAVKLLNKKQCVVSKGKHLPDCPFFVCVSQGLLSSHNGRLVSWVGGVGWQHNQTLSFCRSCRTRTCRVYPNRSTLITYLTST